VKVTQHSSGFDRNRFFPVRNSVSRIAENLVRPSTAATSQQLSDFVSRAIHTRRLRNRHFPESLFGEPAWDMLLELLHAGIEKRELTVPQLCEAVGVPGAIALRWLNSLANEGLVVRRPDPQNSLSEIVELEPRTRAAFHRYAEDLSHAGGS
jgi:DNA-binding MarR family transcriptional regulator